MSNRFEIQVVALDKATAVFRKVNTSLAQTFRPVTRLQKQVGQLGREMHLGAITKGMRSLSAASAKVAQSLGLSTAPLEALFGLGAAGGIVAAGAAVAALGARWGTTGFEINKTATAIGVSTSELQEFRGIAKLAGVDSAVATKSLANMARTIQDADFGRNPAAYQVLNQFGIGIKRNAAGVVDAKATFSALADVLAKETNPQIRELITSTLGIDSEMLPVLMRGSKGIEELAKQVAATGYVMGPDQIKNATEYGNALARLSLIGETIANKWGAKVTPALTRVMDVIQDVEKKGGVSFSDIFGMTPSSSASYRMAFGGSDRSAQRSSGTVTGDAPAGAGGPLPLGLRQNNPGNLRSWGGNPTENGFARFGTAEDGLSAMAQQIGLYGNRDGLRSINGILGKYAPSSENNTAAYAAAVSKDTGFAADAQLNTNDPKVLAPLLSAMVKHEQGRQPFNDDAYAKAASTVKVEVAFANAPPGTQASAHSAGAAVPARVSYALATSDGP